MEVFRPSAVVLQCGADSLAGDKLGCFNLSMEGHASCVTFLRKHNVPLILLGGGGYTVKNVARTWAYETACALGIESEIDKNLPWNEYFDWFGPRYRLEVAPNNMEDMNLRESSLEKVR
jgi:histone deacetylase 1/2